MNSKTIKFNTNQQALANKKQAGFSLIELLVASLIGIFIVAGVITNFVGTKDSERARSAISEMDSNARVAMDFLRVTIGHASYGTVDDLPDIQAFHANTTETLVDNDCRGGAEKVLNGAIPPDIKMTEDGNASNKNNDQVTVVYLADNPCQDGATECIRGGENELLINPIHASNLVYYDCVGGGATKNARAVACSGDTKNGLVNARDAKIYSSFFVRKKSGKSGLYCAGSASKNQKIELVEDVENMQLRYGVFNGTTTRYLTATEVNAESIWGEVNSVQVALLMRSSATNVLKTKTKQIAETDSVSSDDTSFTYNLLGTDVTIINKDRRLYRVYSTTIKITNRDKGRIL